MAKPKKWVTIGASVAIAAAIYGLVYLGYSGLNKAGEALGVAGEQIQEEAAAFASGTDSEGCVKEAVKRDLACSGMICRIESKVFLNHCLQSAETPEGFCDGVPKRELGNIIGSVMWRKETCSGLGHPELDRCGTLMDEVQDFCHPAEKKEEPAGKAGEREA